MLVCGGEGIIPALAGNTRRAVHSTTMRRDHPRSRGEYARSVTSASFTSGSSPLSRGIRKKLIIDFEIVRIIPALAGNTRDPQPRPRRRQDHPRSRGEYAPFCGGCGMCAGSSPLSRGILMSASQHLRRDRIIPALAGNTPAASSPATGWRDHPRSRGEYVVEDDTEFVGEGSSRSRGEYSGRRCATRSPHGSSPLSRGIRWWCR